MNGRKLAAVAGFILLGLSPSFVDWMQAPERRGQMVAFYAGGVGLIWWGLLR